MDLSNREKGGFPKTSGKSVLVIVRIKGTLVPKNISISIAPTENGNYVSVECANQLILVFLLLLLLLYYN
jgi:hypothetical protein